MEKTFSNRDQKIQEYVRQTFQPEDSILREIRERSQKAGLPMIQVADMDSLHLEVITKAIGAKKAVEIGTLGGYSGVAIARGLAKGGKLYTFEYHEHHAKVAQESFEKADVSKKVQILIGSAINNLSKIERFGPFDLIFIDADKEGYPNYLAWAEKYLRVGGIVLADNTFGFGMIADRDIGDKQTARDVQSLRDFNSKLAKNPRFRATILPTGEGLTFAVKVK